MTGFDVPAMADVFAAQLHECGVDTETAREVAGPLVQHVADVLVGTMFKTAEDVLAARNVFMSCTFLHPIKVENAALVWNHECGHCNELVDSPVCDVDHALVATELGWCACGSTDRIDELVYRYLAWVALPMESRPRRDEQLTADLGLLLAYVCDDLGWTEHGTSINGEWLTDDGHTALANLRAAVRGNGGDQ